MKTAAYGKKLENLWNKIDVRLLSNKKKLFKIDIKIKLYVKVDNDLVAIRKSKVILKLSKPAYAGMCILDRSKVLMYEFRYDYIKNRHNENSALLILKVGCMKSKLKMFMKILVRIKICLILAIFQLSQNIIITEKN